MLQKALAKRPEDRYASANDLGQALRDVIAKPSSVPTPPTNPSYSPSQVPVAAPSAGFTPQPIAQPGMTSQPGAQAPAMHVNSNYPAAAPADGGLLSSRAAWLVLGLGALLALIGAAALVLAILLH